MTTIHIPLDPVPASRPRVSRWGTYYGKRYTKFRKDMARCLQDASLKVLAGPLIVMVWVLVSKPKSTKLRHPKPDVDNYAKAVLDGLNGVLWEDDSQIVTLTVLKRWADDEPGVWVQATHLDGDPVSAMPPLPGQRKRPQRRQPEGLR